MKTKTLLASLAVSALALSQPAAAATRSFQSLPENGVQPASVQRTGAPVAASEEAANPVWLIFAALGLAAVLIILITDGDGDGDGNGGTPDPVGESPG